MRWIYKSFYGKRRNLVFKRFIASTTRIVENFDDYPGPIRVSETTGDRWISAIGLEVHTQIKSKSKLFSDASAIDPNAPVNSNVSFLDASVPGTLPVLNRRCVEAALSSGLALNCQINQISSFDRKHYFYCDLPLGYQITQNREPIARFGKLPFWVIRHKNLNKTYSKTASVTQLQLEMDSGKSIHDDVDSQSLIDLNRCGVGLMEIVFGPDLFDGEEAASLVKELRSLLTKIDASTCKMEDGALRVDANVSVRRPGEPLGVRTETKNLNSIKSISSAIEYEVHRQINLLESGFTIYNETRTYDPNARITLPMRDKEGKRDYRFMPEPNLPPLRLSKADIQRCEKNLPDLPENLRNDLISSGISPEWANFVISEPQIYNLYHSAVPLVQNPKLLVHILSTSVQEFLKLEGNIENKSLSCARLVEITNARNESSLQIGSIEKALKHYLTTSDETRDLKTLVKDNSWESMTEDQIKEIIRDIFDNNQKTVAKILKGKDKEIGRLYRYANKHYSQKEYYQFYQVREEIHKELTSLKKKEKLI